MNDRDDPDIRAWEPGWDGHAAAQRRRLARLPLAEKLQWLEEAQRLAQQLTDGARGRTPMPETGTPLEDAAEE